MDDIIKQDAAIAVQDGMKLQQMKSQFQATISVQRPRDIKKVEDELTKEAAIAGENFYYQWTLKGGGMVDGVSIKGAMILARLWGNCSAEIVEEKEDDEFIKFKAAFVDFETNFSVSRVYKISKRFTIYGRMDEFRKHDIKVQIGQSKALRNVILSGIPEWLIEKGKEIAKKNVRKKIEDFIQKEGKVKAIELLVNGLKKYGVKESAICEKFGVKRVSALELNHLVIMKGDLAAIQNGNEYANELYPDTESKATVSGRIKSKAEEIKKNGASQKELSLDEAWKTLNADLNSVMIEIEIPDKDRGKSRFEELSEEAKKRIIEHVKAKNAKR